MTGWKWRREAKSQVSSSLPPETDLLAVTQGVVDRLRTEGAWDSAGGDLERIDVVHVTVGQHVAHYSEPGVCLRWTQGENKFGLVMPISRLALQAGGVEAIPFYLQLAIDEPHGATSDGSRWWFLNLPSGPYE